MVIRIDSPSASRDVSREELLALASPDGVPFTAIAALVDIPASVTHATFHAVDGYAASVPIARARDSATIVVPGEDECRTGVRLMIRGADRTCVNVKAVVRIELTIGPGKDTVDPNPHDAARVPGWDA